ncbi:restriction endonuclease [Cetobacterium sp.]|uniref:restriction endonuclease n=1 Tax=Cetobacterium sp. TaxID=2071632 RepID=UPI003EE4DF35
MLKDSNQEILPLGQLSERQFEEIVYDILVERNNYPQRQVYLMPSGKDGGKDIFIQFKCEIKTIIQCKRYKENISKKILLEELAKLALNLEIDNIENLNYEMWVANDFKPEVYDLLVDNTCFLAEDEYEPIMKKVLQTYKELQAKFTLKDAINKFKDFVTQKLYIVKLVTGYDISQEVRKIDSVYKKYFEHKRVISYEDLEKVMENYNKHPLANLLKEWMEEKVKNYLEFLLQLVTTDDFLTLSKKQFKQLQDFNLELKRRFVNKSYGRISDVFISFRKAYEDFLKMYENYKQDSDGVFRIPRFYKLNGWLPQDEYDKLFKEYNIILSIFKNMVLELVKLSNYICELLEDFGPQLQKAMFYKYEELYTEWNNELPIYYDETWNLQYQMLDIEYSISEKEKWTSYTDISQFQNEMYLRESYFPEG